MSKKENPASESTTYPTQDSIGITGQLAPVTHDDDGLHFPVSAVELADNTLAELETKSALISYLGGPVEAYELSTSHLIDPHALSKTRGVAINLHPFVAALATAFAQHRPLILKPDHIWLLICQGVATHIRQNAETLRHHFVTHDGQLELELHRDDFIKGNPHNPWASVFPKFTQQIKTHIGPAHDWFIADFSTTEATEKSAYELVLMSSMQAYFRFTMASLCGIPQITLQGTADDWAWMISAIDRFRPLGLDWWLDELHPILTQLAATARGQADIGFWQSIYKFNSSSLGTWIDGWIIKLFPYIRNREQTITNQEFKAIRTTSFPSGSSSVPFIWHYLDNQYDMSWLTGFMGISQVTTTKALKPEIGWVMIDKEAYRQARNKMGQDDSIIQTKKNHLERGIITQEQFDQFMHNYENPF
ncbi:MAG TPA: DUF4419 domain-containing protein [Anaerolineae bacterium]|nr:DUF4419 domain-containing protein [Anaerolineae bacterium]